MAIEAHILVVDDEVGMRDMLGFELGDRGHKVDLAADGAQAIEQLERAEYDLVITDVLMPNVDGVAVLKAAKEISPDTEVIVVTGYAELDSAIECLRAGACDLIQKPLHLEDLLSSVDRAIEHRRLRVTARLYQACQEMLGSGEARSLYERIAATAMELLGADDVSVMLLDSDRCLRIVHATGIPEAVQAETRVALGERVAGRVALECRPAILPAALSDDPRFEGLDSYGRVRSGIIYPLAVQDVVLGVLNLNRVHASRHFRRTDLETAGIIAAQAALALRNERLAQDLVASERMATIGQFAAGIVHELGNPLTYISASATLAREILGSLPRDAEGSCLLASGDLRDIQDSLSHVEQGVDRLGEIAVDMRRLSRKEEDSGERFDVNEAIRTAMRIAGPTLRRSAETSTELGEGLLVIGSSGQLSQVFLNLLVNAAQSLETVPGKRGKIGIRSWRDAGKVLVEVTDDGPGIPPHHLSRIMEPFYTTKSREKGSGLGLAISREIAERHGGSLRVRSRACEETAFTVSLPAAPPSG
ncbi:MAG: response regulator [Deltaproteobacteria bacterium]|nr:response regulator [Deltaproteobacteria bacterium]